MCEVRSGLLPTLRPATLTVSSPIALHPRRPGGRGRSQKRPQPQPLHWGPTHPPQESPGVAPGSAEAPAPAPRSPLPAGPPDAAKSPAPEGEGRVRRALPTTPRPSVRARGSLEESRSRGPSGQLTAWASPSRVRSSRFSRWVSWSRAQRSCAASSCSSSRALEASRVPESARSSWRGEGQRAGLAMPPPALCSQTLPPLPAPTAQPWGSPGPIPPLHLPDRGSLQVPLPQHLAPPFYHAGPAPSPQELPPGVASF